VLAPWCNWLTRGPFKAESPGSSPGGATKLRSERILPYAPQEVFSFHQTLVGFRQLFRRIGVEEGMPKRSRSSDVVFEGVLIPKGTRSARLAAKGITTVEEMSEFLTAIFSDTLTGKIKLPKPGTNGRVSRKMLDGIEEKLKQGVPMSVRAPALRLAPETKNPRRSKTGRATKKAGASGARTSDKAI
jgi:hypothetical protein